MDLDELLNTSADLVRERFDLYYVGLFLVDEHSEWAILRAATGEAGRDNLRREHKLKVGGQSMIGKCIALSQPRIALDVATEAVRFDNPTLPETRSEAAYPLVARGRTIGAMTIQSSHTAAFGDEDILTFQILTDQLANAIENVRLFQRAEESLEEMSRMHQRYLRQEWQEYLADEEARARAGYLYDHGVVRPAGDASMPEIALAMQRGETVALSEHLPERAGADGGTSGGYTDTYTRDLSGRFPNPQSAMAVPLALRGQIIGALGFYETEQPRRWSSDDIALVESVADQVALAIENARAYAELQKTAERLKELDRLKSQFLANMSHELRTPLNSIIGFSRVILKGVDGPLTDMQHTDLQAVYDSGQHLLKLINDILDISKIQAGRMEISIEDVNLYEIIESCMSTAIALVKDKPIELQQAIEPDLPILHGDGRRIRQVLLNLVGNAANFTEKGFIRVEAKATPTEVMISVADSGIGIAVDKQKTIFEEFTQVDGSSTRRSGGTGLGLAISRHFVDMHGGRIWVESTPGEGATFYVTLPVEVPPQAGEESEADGTMRVGTPGEEAAEGAGAGEQPRRLVLCVDDDEGVITLFRRYLSKRGYRVVGLTESAAVLEKARQLKPFAITLDVMMPKKDGWQVIQELKADADTRHIPVIMATIISEKEYGLSLGATDYLVKPILEDDLLSALERLDRDQDRHRVLVVDDQAESRSLLRRMIESRPGYEVLEASGGLEAIRLVQEEQPHIIVLDLMMPDVDGFAVLESVKADEATRSIPIIVVTAKDLTQEERDMLNRGVEALLQKGLYEQQELLADVVAALERIKRNEE
jgi:signal transduction histidine kinase/CheY-like chemotaxis protein/putative methionine-R-sulfoxide reductase with GAF domain